MAHSPQHSLEQYEAVILDLDGVITRTAGVHARAWKRMFDEYLQRRRERGESLFEPLAIDPDYVRYVDGKPRYDGVRSFLASRGVELPEGDPEDPPSEETVCGLGNRKNELFQQLLHEQGVEVYEDAVERIEQWRRRGLKMAVVSASKNCATILEAAGLTDSFDARVDGLEAVRLGLPGKPAPDTFLEAARQLGVSPSRAVVLEDAVAGVQAGQAGGFGLVVGVAREGQATLLEENGADLVVRDLRELDGSGPQASPLPSALERLEEISRLLAGKRAAVFLDYDGTLTPIVERPEDARLDPAMHEVLRKLASRCPAAVISGRDRADVQQLVGLPELIYAGSHGFDIAGPDGLRQEQQAGQACLPDLDGAEQALRQRLGSVAGVAVERKRFALAVHYRRAAERDVPQVEAVVDRVQADHPRLRKRGGKKIFELQPNIAWDKGRAVLWLLEVLELDRPDVLPLYLGDDLTDEDAFRALAGRGLGILAGELPPETAARYHLRDTAEVQQFLSWLAEQAC